MIMPADENSAKDTQKNKKQKKKQKKEANAQRKKENAASLHNIVIAVQQFFSLPSVTEWFDRNPKQIVACNKNNFTRDLEPNLTDTLTKLVVNVVRQCCMDTTVRQPIKNGVKINSYGSMTSIGYKGGACGTGEYRGYHASPVGAPSTNAKVKVATALHEYARNMGYDYEIFPDVIVDPVIDTKNNVLETLACYITVNFSHARDLKEYKRLLHRDSRDMSSTVLHVYQNKATPTQNQAYWFCERDDGEMEVMSLAAHEGNGLTGVFNGRGHLHGVIPPHIFNPMYPWFGATLVRKAWKRAPARDHDQQPVDQII